MNAAAKVLACEIVGLRLIDENDPSYVVLAASTGVDERSTRVLRRGPVTEGIGGRAIVEERLLISNAYGSGEGEIQMLAANGLRAAMAAPVHGHGSIVGSLVVATRRIASSPRPTPTRSGSSPSTRAWRSPRRARPTRCGRP